MKDWFLQLGVTRYADGETVSQYSTIIDDIITSVELPDAETVEFCIDSYTRIYGPQCTDTIRTYSREFFRDALVSNHVARLLSIDINNENAASVMFGAQYTATIVVRESLRRKIGRTPPPVLWDGGAIIFPN